jgi:hypothetical protein
MDHPSIPEQAAGERIVYIRAVAASELPEEARARAAGQSIYAIHDAAGQRLALVADRDLAFVVARQNELTPVSAH